MFVLRYSQHVCLRLRIVLLQRLAPFLFLWTVFHKQKTSTPNHRGHEQRRRNNNNTNKERTKTKTHRTTKWNTHSNRHYNEHQRKRHVVDERQWLEFHHGTQNTHTTRLKQLQRKQKRRPRMVGCANVRDAAVDWKLVLESRRARSRVKRYLTPSIP